MSLSLSAMVKDLPGTCKQLVKNPTQFAGMHDRDRDALKEKIEGWTPKTDEGKTSREGALAAIASIETGAVEPEDLRPTKTKAAKAAKEPKPPKEKKVREKKPLFYGYDTKMRQALIAWIAPLMKSGGFTSLDAFLASNPTIPSEHQVTIDAIKKRTQPRIWGFLNTDILQAAGIEKPKAEKPEKPAKEPKKKAAKEEQPAAAAQ